MPRVFPTFAARAAAGLVLVAGAGCSVPDQKSPDAVGDVRPSVLLVADQKPSASEGAAQEPLLEPAPVPMLSDRDIDWQANSVMSALGGIARTVRHTEYSHGQRVDVQQGLYVFDCSSMARWVLKRAAPMAERSLSRGLSRRPLAADFQRRIASVLPGEERGGWRRVERVEDAQAGDVVAWLKPKIIDSKNTGHVAFVVLPPRRASGYSDAYLVRVVDATSLLHADDTRVEGSGFGFGTILLVVDPETGAPRAYGWVGLEWRAFETSIAIGRATG
jgi:hypothetical protein